MRFTLLLTVGLSDLGVAFLPVDFGLRSVLGAFSDFFGTVSLGESFLAALTGLSFATFVCFVRLAGGSFSGEAGLFPLTAFVCVVAFALVDAAFPFTVVAVRERETRAVVVAVGISVGRFL